MIITIIIATWNAAKTLNKCLDSIVTQLTNETELVIIDGGSKDETLSIIKEYSQYVSFNISEKDKGIYDAWNKGVKVAKGDWVMFIGADDILLPGAINSYLKYISETDNVNEYDYICALNEHVDKNGKVLKILGGEPRWNIYRKNMNAAHVASLHNRKNLFATIGYYDLQFKICADYDLLLRKRNNLKWLFLPVHIARMQVGGMSFSLKAIKETFLIRKKNHSVPFIVNCILFTINVLAYYNYILKHKIRGGKI
jgi:glycosyltransferase involved in cell wall biosynthesis